jgi:hypothetical protein
MELVCNEDLFVTELDVPSGTDARAMNGDALRMLKKWPHVKDIVGTPGEVKVQGEVLPALLLSGHLGGAPIVGAIVTRNTTLSLCAGFATVDAGAVATTCDRVNAAVLAEGAAVLARAVTAADALPDVHAPPPENADCDVEKDTRNVGSFSVVCDDWTVSSREIYRDLTMSLADEVASQERESEAKHVDSVASACAFAGASIPCHRVDDGDATLFSTAVQTRYGRRLLGCGADTGAAQTPKDCPFRVTQDLTRVSIDRDDHGNERLSTQ